MAAQIQGLDTEYKPWGGLAGIMTGVREADTEAANLLALQESQLGNVVKARDAAFAQDEMGNQELRNARMQGMIGDSQVKTAAGRTAMGTQKSDMNAKIAENLAKVPKAQVEQALANTHLQTQGLMGLAASLEQSGGGLEFATKAIEMAPKLGIQPQDLQQILSNPKRLQAMIAQNQQMLTMVPAVLQKMAEQKQHAKVQGEYITAPTNYAHIQAAQINADAHLKAAYATAAAHKETADKSRTMEQTAAYFMKLATEADTDEERDVYMFNYQKALDAAEKLKTAATSVKTEAEKAAMEAFLRGKGDKGKKQEKTKSGAIIIP